MLIERLKGLAGRLPMQTWTGLDPIPQPFWAAKQLDAIALFMVYTGAAFLSVLLMVGLGILGYLVTGRPHNLLLDLGATAPTFVIVGMWLAIVRYFATNFGRRSHIDRPGSREGAGPKSKVIRWLVTPQDADLALQGAASAAVFVWLRLHNL
jgi:hypothetical protein